MLNGFKLSLDNVDPFADWIKDGREILESTWPKKSRELDDFIAKGVLDGDAIKGKWFQKTNAHVFISHAHANESQALGLAGFLWKKLGLLPFVDSLIWGDQTELQSRIDRKYCWTDNKKETFNYDKRNYSTSHVHMMLATSLTAAMDSCECLIFLDTPKSISIADADAPDLGKVATESPWIYHELMTSSVLERKADERRPELKLAMESHRVHASDGAGIDEPLRVAYRAPVKHLSQMPVEKLQEAARRNVRTFDALDWLYQHGAPNDRGPFVLLKSLLEEVKRKG
ncbi:hypothetical protein P3W24_12265 [Luteibacter sp. PPL201]|uniref:Uncharacterized protein n=1 Tax=Luteibacter sahnii TaxID=3021977 RepID=A0ABT6BCH2_9GAMM